MKRARLASRALLGVLLCGASSPALAEDRFAADTFEPVPAGDRFTGVESPESLGEAALDLAFVNAVGFSPVAVQVSGVDGTTPLIGAQFVQHLGAALTLDDDWKLSVDLPWGAVSVSDDVEGAAPERSTQLGLGDLRLGLRGFFGGEPDEAFRAAISGTFFLPTGSESAFLSDGALRAGPRLILGGHGAGLRWGFTSGVMFRAERRFFDVTLGDVLENRLALSTGLTQNGSLVFEAWNGILIEGPNKVSSSTTTLELQLGFRNRMGDLIVAPSLGFGASQGIGTPVVRGLVTIAYAPQERSGWHDWEGDDDYPVPPPPPPPPPGLGDADGDGIRDAEDACIAQAGIYTDEAITRGCPDRDGDGVVDYRDACPSQPGRPDDDPSKRGCPALDRDGDGLPDGDDMCPDQPGVPSDDPLSSGCPADSDNDGILDTEDACPNEKGHLALDPGRNGCPRRAKEPEEVDESDDDKPAGAPPAGRARPPQPRR
jgi:OOP family OmpA-OmpF porin